MTQPGVFRFGDFVLDAKRRLLERGADDVVDLQPKVFDTLLYFVCNADRVITKNELFDTIWSGAVVTEDVLTRVVSALRKALGDDAASPRFIRAVRGVGYRFVETVAVVPDATSHLSRPRSLAVLPFRAVAATDRDESLELGMADTLIARLSVLPELIVRPLSAVRSYLTADTDALTMARALHVDAVLDASLQAGQDRLRVNVRLVSTERGESLWSESFDERFADVFELQDAIADHIVSRLLPHITDDEALGSRLPQASPDAYREYLEGRLFMARHTPADIQRAMDHFETALDNTPTYAEAWVSLGESHELLGTESGVDSAAHYAAARRAARRALALAPDLPEAECLLAKIAWQHEWDWQGAESGFRRVIGLYPNRADLHIHYADYCCILGRVDEGIALAQRALQIDPVSPWCNSILAQGLYMAGRYDEAVRQANRTLKLAPDFHFAKLFAGLASFCRGDRDQGIELLEQATESGRVDFLGALALCYGQANRIDEARGVLERLTNGEGSAPRFAVGSGSLGCGQTLEAEAAFQQCVEDRHWQILLLHSDPIFVKSGERFPGILKQLGLASPGSI